MVVVLLKRLSSFPIWESALFGESCKTTPLIQDTGFVISLCRGLPKSGPRLFSRNTTSVRQTQRGGKMPPPYNFFQINQINPFLFSFEHRLARLKGYARLRS